MTEDKTTQIKIMLLSPWPELMNPLWIMPKDIRARAKLTGCILTEELLDLDPYLGRLWYVCADKRSSKQKMGWLVNHYNKLKDVHFLRPDTLDELWVQVHLGFVPANKVGDIFARIGMSDYGGLKTIGEIAHDLGLYAEEDIHSIIKQVIKDNPGIVAQYKESPKVLGALVGKVREHGITNLKEAVRLLLEELI